MIKPARPTPVAVTLTPEDAFDLEARIARGEFASLDEAVAAELAELNYRRAADIVGGSAKLQRLLNALEAEGANPDECVEADAFFADMLTGLKARAQAAGE